MIDDHSRQRWMHITIDATRFLKTVIWKHGLTLSFSGSTYSGMTWAETISSFTVINNPRPGPNPFVCFRRRRFFRHHVESKSKQEQPLIVFFSV